MAASGSLKRNLGLWSIVGLGLGYMTPTVVFDTFGIVSDETNGAVPSAYLIALIVMVFTAFSYGKMVKVFPTAGSAYTYTRETMSPGLGFLVGWTSLMDYLLLPMVNCLIARLYMESLVPDAPPWVWVVLYTVIMTAIVAVSMRGTANLNGVLLVFAVTMVTLFCIVAVVNLTNGDGSGIVFSAEPFMHEGVHMSALLTGATVVCFSFIGFDAVTMYTNEAKHVNLMPKAILLTVLAGGAIFLVASYFAQQLFPDNSQFNVVDDPLPEIGLLTGGPVFMGFFLAAAFAATVASGLASHASVSRMLLVMGRNGVLPRKAFGYIHPKTHTPMFNIILVGAVCLLAMSFSLEFISALINFGALIAFTFVNLTVIAHFAFRTRQVVDVKSAFNYVVLPAIGAILTGILWVSLHETALIGGVVWLAIGVIYLAVLTRGFKRTVRSFDDPEADAEMSEPEAKPEAEPEPEAKPESV
ncbi:MAG: APC family permease [Brevibacterium aurantiacum]|uniref:Amino acid permease n=1 Tax=Brevibacterium aurantiacum TaxID=273384 RepID=A0A1D7W7Y1_BREAU|nr:MULTISPECIES: APC family permease [Brevibacterium]MDN5609226.1 APC family permease [Brevibacterium sp.]AOP55136.1 Putrescine importer [Brevibacterium aurantiacum]AZL07024.1 amino acid permease [Brevibacterium aurantiacum]MDN5660698.1 APC family permease [Brevibacterium aurantiacum]MDN5712324.1 APC family permease [Brevibacterium aurantiacum]